MSNPSYEEERAMFMINMIDQMDDDQLSDYLDMDLEDRFQFLMNGDMRQGEE